MKEIRVNFQKVVRQTDSMFSFRFVPSEKIEFIPGHFLQLIFDEKNRQNKNLNKYLSFSCMPGKEYIEVTKRISESDFSKSLLGLKEGDSLLIKAPMGTCLFQPDIKKIAFLAGGIGVTPAISIIEYIAENQLAIDVNMLYSNRNVNDIAFKKMLDTYSLKYSNINVEYFVDECSENVSEYHCGCISEKMISKCILDSAERVFYIYGPPVMVNFMRDFCSNLGIHSERLKIEKFIGY